MGFLAARQTLPEEESTLRQFHYYKYVILFTLLSAKLELIAITRF